MNSAVKALIWYGVFIGLILALENIESVFGWLPEISGAKVKSDNISQDGGDNVSHGNVNKIKGTDKIYEDGSVINNPKIVEEAAIKAKELPPLTELDKEYAKAILISINQMQYIRQGLEEGVFNYSAFNAEVRKLMRNINETTSWAKSNLNKENSKQIDSRFSSAMLEVIAAKDSFISMDGFWNTMIKEAGDVSIEFDAKRAREFSMTCALFNADAAMIYFNGAVDRETAEDTKSKDMINANESLAYINEYKKEND